MQTIYSRTINSNIKNTASMEQREAVFSFIHATFTFFLWIGLGCAHPNSRRYLLILFWGYYNQDFKDYPVLEGIIKNKKNTICEYFFCFCSLDYPLILLPRRLLKHRHMCLVRVHLLETFP